MLIFYTLNRIMGFSFLQNEVGGVGIPVFHTSVNLLGCAIWLPLSDVLVALAMRTLPLSEREKQDQANKLTILDSNLLVTPDIAIEQANTAVTLLSGTVGDAFVSVVGTLRDPDMADKVSMLCERSERYRNQIDEYLVEISERDIDRECRAYHKLISSANTAFGRMGKLAERLFELIRRSAESPDEIVDGGEVEAGVLGGSIFEIIQLTINGFTVKSGSVSQTMR